MSELTTPIRQCEYNEEPPIGGSPNWRIYLRIHVERVHSVRVEPFIAGHERVTIQSEVPARGSHFQFWRSAQ